MRRTLSCYPNHGPSGENVILRPKEESGDGDAVYHKHTEEESGGVDPNVSGMSWMLADTESKCNPFVYMRSAPHLSGGRAGASVRGLFFKFNTCVPREEPSGGMRPGASERATNVQDDMPRAVGRGDLCDAD